MREKEELLESVSEVIESDSLSLRVIINVVIIALIALMLLVPKIYFSSQIYIFSLKLNSKLNEYYSLKAENEILKAKIEMLKFKNRLNLYKELK